MRNERVYVWSGTPFASVRQNKRVGTLHKFDGVERLIVASDNIVPSIRALKSKAIKDPKSLTSQEKNDFMNYYRMMNPYGQGYDETNIITKEECTPAFEELTRLQTVPGPANKK